MAQSQTAVMQAYSPPLSLWSLVEEHVPSSEQEEVKSMLGNHIVDQSMELHSEIEMLLEIWRDMRDEAEESKLVQSQLPEPPNQRERLIQEINFFAESCKEKARNKGIDPQDIMKNHNKNILEYVSDISRPGSAMGRTSRSSDGRETPMMAASPDRILRAFEVTDEIEAANDQLNVNKFDEVCAHLRSTLEKEINQLFGDIEFLQNCLDNEADIRDCVDTPRVSREPTLTELREERASLEKELLLDNLTFTPQVDRPQFKDSVIKPIPTASSLNAPLKLTSEPLKKSIVQANHLMKPQVIPERQITPPLSRNSSRGGGEVPLKAVHDLQITKTQTVSGVNPLSPRHTSKMMMSGGGSTSFMPSPPKAPLSDNRKQNIIAQKLPDSSPSAISTTHSSQSREGRADQKIHRGRRTVSPGRVRVVNLNSIVGMHSGKGDNSIPSVGDGMQDSSDPLLPFDSVSPNSSGPSSVESSLRPSSASRFRKMVMGCRDGE